MGSEEEEVSRDGMEGFTEEGTQLGGNCMNRKRNRRLRAGGTCFPGVGLFCLCGQNGPKDRRRLLLTQGPQGVAEKD